MAMFLEQNISILFPLCLWPFCSKLLSHPVSVGERFHLMECALNPNRYWSVTLESFVPLL